MLLYALMIPVLFMACGVGLDMGWYYLNVSRLQNAADAAVIAGARALIEDSEDFSDYSSGTVQLVGKFYATDETGTTVATDAGDKVAAQYVLKNLSSDAKAVPATGVTGVTTYTMEDNWGLGASSQITMTPTLYKVGNSYYYVIHLVEKIHHLFMPGLENIFPAMDAPVIAVALMNPATEDPEDPVDPVVVPEKVIEKIETAVNTNVIVGNWEVQNYYRYVDNTAYTYTDTVTGKKVNVSRSEQYKENFGYEVYVSAWNMFSDLWIHYKGDLYRTETINILDNVVLKNPNAAQVDKYKDDNVSFGSYKVTGEKNLGTAPPKKAPFTKRRRPPTAKNLSARTARSTSPTPTTPPATPTPRKIWIPSTWTSRQKLLSTWAARTSPRIGICPSAPTTRTTIIRTAPAAQRSASASSAITVGMTTCAFIPR